MHRDDDPGERALYDDDYQNEPVCEDCGEEMIEPLDVKRGMHRDCWERSFV